MKIPDKLKVGAISYTVTQEDRIIDGSGELAGRIDYPATEIRVLKHADDDYKMQSFYHEMIHAIYEHIGANRGTCPPDERDVDSLASALLMVVKDNPAVFGVEHHTKPPGNLVFDESTGTYRVENDR